MFATPRQKAQNHACASRGVTVSADGGAGRSAILEASCMTEASKEERKGKKEKTCTQGSYTLLWTEFFQTIFFLFSRLKVTVRFSRRNKS